MNTRLLADANELCRLGVGELTAGFGSGRFTPLEVTQATLARAEQVQEQYNAFSLIDVDAALAMAKKSTARWRSGAPVSVIDGVPTTVKDILWVKDRAVRYGSRTTSTIPCAQDAPSVKRLRAAGAVLIGLTTTPEFGWKAITDSPLTRTARSYRRRAISNARDAKVVPAHEVNSLHIRQLWDPTAGSCYSAQAWANKSWWRYRHPKTERSCIGVYPGRDARTRQTKLRIRIWPPLWGERARRLCAT